MDNKRKRFISAASVISMELLPFMQNAPKCVTDNAHEITLRVNRPLCVLSGTKRYYFTKNNCVTDAILSNEMVTCSSRSIFETFQNICNFSVYSKQNEINNGYITLKGGHRAGICGTAVINKGEIVNIKDISSINIRISREFIGCSDELYQKLNLKSGVLICGAPCSGKTTLIRDLARRLSYESKVSVIDERNELSSTVNGVAQNDMGLCDIFDSYIKSDAIIHAVRSMSPDIIICDEISTDADVSAIISGVNSGVSFVATIHADNFEKIKNRTIFKKLIDTNAFSKIVFLDTRDNAGKITAIYDASDCYV